MVKLNESWSERSHLIQLRLATKSTEMKQRDTRQKELSAPKSSATCGLETTGYLLSSLLKLQLSLRNCFSDQTVTFGLFYRLTRILVGLLNKDNI